MRLTNQFSVMGRKYDLAYGQANTWKRKLKNDKYELIENAIDKLGQLEDIEEELGVDLITLFKALKNGIWVKYKKLFWDKEKTIEYYKPEDFVICFQQDFTDNYEAMFFKVRIYGDFFDNDVGREIEGDFGDTIYLSTNYGKTWALTKEELL